MIIQRKPVLHQRSLTLRRGLSHLLCNAKQNVTLHCLSVRQHQKWSTESQTSPLYAGFAGHHTLSVPKVHIFLIPNNNDNDVELQNGLTFPASIQSIGHNMISVITIWNSMMIMSTQIQQCTCLNIWIWTHCKDYYAAYLRLWTVHIVIIKSKSTLFCSHIFHCHDLVKKSFHV